MTPKKPRLKTPESAAPVSSDKIDIGAAVLRMRQSKGLSGAALCRRAGDLDPKTLNALEKGRILNPSVQTLQSLARGLETTVSEFFRGIEMDRESCFHLGSQKGVYQVDFGGKGVKLISFTPLNKDFFCGKLLLGARQKLGPSLLRHRFPIYMAVVMGRIEGKVEDRSFVLKEGENVFFHGALNYSFYNPLGRESVFQIVTAPSFL